MIDNNCFFLFKPKQNQEIYKEWITEVLFIRTCVDLRLFTSGTFPFKHSARSFLISKAGGDLHRQTIEITESTCSIIIEVLSVCCSRRRCFVRCLLFLYWWRWLLLALDLFGLLSHQMTSEMIDDIKSED